jgi:ABC-2 type transport system ATP-binding protein
VNQQRIVEEIRRLRHEGGTILLSAHQMDLVETLADRILLLDRGREVLRGTLAEIRTRAGSRVRLRLGVRPGTAADGLGSVPGVARADRPAPDRVDLLLEPHAEVGEVLHAITSRHAVVSVHSGAESLREIFVRTVGRPVEPEEESP